jgi:hypothetical protein
MSAARTSVSDRARAAWGGDIPDWVLALAKACDESSQSAVAKRIGKSGALVSTVLNKAYGAGLTAVEQVVRGALMSATVDCPAVGEMPADLCITHQRETWSPHNPQRIALYRACRAGCPHSRLGGRDAE